MGVARYFYPAAADRRDSVKCAEIRQVDKNQMVEQGRIRYLAEMEVAHSFHHHR